MSFQLSIVTPQGKVFENKVDSVAAVGVLGGLEVYTGHEPILVALKSGAIKVRNSGREQMFNTGSGILEVSPDHNVLVLVDSASTAT